MISVRCLIFIIIFSIVFNSCSKDDASGQDQLIIDAKLFISEPSSIIVDLSQNDFLNQINPVSSVTLLNDAGESLNVRKVEANVFKSELNLDMNNFSKTDEFKLELLLANGEIVESDWRTHLPNRIEFSKKLSIDDNDVSFSLRFKNERFNDKNYDTYFLKWDAEIAYSIGNYILTGRLLGDNNCSRWEGANICDLLNQASGEELMAKIDCDGDGFSNAIECDYGTDPRRFNESIDFYNPTSDPSYNCYVTKKPILDKHFVEVVPIDDPFDFETNLSFLLRSPLNHEFSETYILHMNVEQISEDQYKFLNGESEINHFTNTSDESYNVSGFFEVTNQESLDFILSDKTSDRDLVVGCDLTTNLPGLEEVCENCKLALQGEGEVKFIRPFYWPIN